MKTTIALAAAVVFAMTTLSFAQFERPAAEYTQRLTDAKDDAEVFAVLKEARNDAFNRQRYSDFVEYLKVTGQKNKKVTVFAQYFIALTRYHQLKFLEAQQDWNEYFSRGEEYREEVGTNLQKSVGATVAKQPLHLASRLLLWQFHKDQESGLDEQFLTQLVAAVQEYAKGEADPQPIKETADTLMLYGLKAQAKELYRLFADRIFASALSNDELHNIAMGFYKDGNIDLAEAVFNVYIERTLNVSSKDKLKLELGDIARMFSYAADKPYDLDFAEKIFQKMEVFLGKDMLDETLLLVRAFNLERAREWARAREIYDQLVTRFPGSAASAQSAFKSAAISAYALRDIEGAKAAYEKIALREPVSAWVVASQYQLGLLNQWQENGPKAKEWFAAVIAKAGTQYPDLVELARARMKEIEENNYMDYNLRNFLDMAFKDEFAQFSMSKAHIQVDSYRVKAAAPVMLTASAVAPESGCMQVQMEYLWSGDVTLEAGVPQGQELSQTFASPGTKIVGLVVSSGSGVVDRAFDLIDVE